MIDPSMFIKPKSEKSELKEINFSITCSEPGCFERVEKTMYDQKNKKAYWTCPNGHDGSATIIYE